MKVHPLSQLSLNLRAARLAESASADTSRLRILKSVREGVTLLDFGVNAAGGLEAGILLARLCMADLADIRIVPPGDCSPDTPQVFIHTDFPVDACLCSQYAGWKIATDDYFAMGSGPMRAIAKTEKLFAELETEEDHNATVGILEAATMPSHAAIELIHEAVARHRHLILAVAPTASMAGTIQVVARSVETAMHKLHELDFPLGAILSGTGAAPLPPVAKNDLQGIGRTNDSILYGATVNLWVRCDDDLITTIGPRVPSCASASHGETFQTLFKAANHDFYALDPALFSPAVVRFHNLTSGRSFSFGRLMPELLRQSFGL